jgi:hypothetical protein
MQQTCHEVLKESGAGERPCCCRSPWSSRRSRSTTSFFIERKLYPNVDFYSGITLRALGFPPEMFTVLFAVARTVGWIAQWKEMIEDPAQKISRPRQLYTGATKRPFVPVDKRADTTPSCVRIRCAYVAGWPRRPATLRAAMPIMCIFQAFNGATPADYDEVRRRVAGRHAGRLRIAPLV